MSPTPTPSSAARSRLLVFSAGFYVYDTRYMVPETTAASTDLPRASAPSSSPSDAAAGPPKHNEALIAEVGDPLLRSQAPQACRRG